LALITRDINGEITDRVKGITGNETTSLQLLAPGYF